MSNDKPIAVAVINFYANKHIEIELDSIAGVTPRTLSIAGNLLSRKYRSMKGKFIADEHKKAREAKKAAEVAAEKKEAEFHKAEDKRLSSAVEAPAEVVEEVAQEDNVDDS